MTAQVRALAARWRSERADRQARRALDRADFDDLRDAGLLALPVPVTAGGAWESVEASTRPICEVFRDLAGADSSVTLVSSMHPAVLAFWLATEDPSQPAWHEQRDAIFASALAGEQWGTITSEPGSGGDIAKTKAIATALDGVSPLPGSLYAITGAKHFGSGSGIADWMMTTAVAQGEDAPTIFVLPMRDRPWDGSAGIRLVAEWDGMGMAATQSHAMHLEAAPGVRLAWDGELDPIVKAASPFFSMLFTAIVLGILDEAVSLARAQLGPKAESLRAFEQTEWTRAELEHWTAVQAYEGGLRAVESGDPLVAGPSALRAKTAVAELAEQSLLRMTRVLGGGTYSRRSPFAHWFEDVRALGFLRPPWGLAFDNLFASSFGEAWR